MCSEEDTGRWCAAVVTKADRLTTSTLCNAPVSDYCQQIGSTKAQGRETIGPPGHNEPGHTLTGSAGAGSDAIKTL